ncbi:LytTR family DNA-binding domain-containing protein [Sphingomonas sp. NPDC019816]|uniref:LytTR family DNA-binding domain-containing protein n=1 Tax=Sphingomonas sp. NPDC019816 TaxID=3390679 RepID=UPI003D079676
MPRSRRLVIDIALMIGVGLLLAVLGPFGTFGSHFAYRLIYWITLMLAGYALYKPMMAGSLALAERLHLPDVAGWATAAILASLPMSIIVWWVERPGVPLRWPDADRALLLYGNVLVIGGLASLLLWHGQKRRRVTSAPAAPEPAPPAADPRPALLDRLPPGFGPDIFALEMEDHYLRVHGAYGSELILLRMRDAVQEVAPLVGAQVHRSWWVARDAVREAHREGRGLRLILTGGVEARVSRAMVPVLEAEGWW